MSNDSKEGGNKVTLAIFEKWVTDRGVKEIFCFKTSTVENCVYVTKVWSKVCAAQHFATFYKPTKFERASVGFIC